MRGSGERKEKDLHETCAGDLLMLHMKNYGCMRIEYMLVRICRDSRYLEGGWASGKTISRRSQL